jgi:hypothetical protein
LPFSTLAEARDAIVRLTDPAEYVKHCAAARAIAEEWFDSRTVLPQLLEAAANGSRARSGGPI